MTLRQLVDSLDDAVVVGNREHVITAIADDSRSVTRGSLFVAVRGERTDGHAFLRQAIERGAGALVVEAGAMPLSFTTGVPTIVVADTRRTLSRLAATFYGTAAAAMQIVGVTGTNGKTTTTYLIEAILAHAGIAAGRIGTLGAAFANHQWSLGNTTPLPLELHRVLAAMSKLGARAVAMEVSSHALALDRVADVHFAVGVLTNITSDHRDFHRSFAAYAAAKRQLLDRSRRVVVNLDDPHARALAAELTAAGRVPIGFGINAGADVRGENLALGPRGSSFTVDGTAFDLRLPGRFNVHNALAAVSVARCFDIADAVSAAALTNVAGVPGRMEIRTGGGVDVIVDYAHTPDALDNLLRAARETTSGRLVVVFGCGGDRDRHKRPQMGKIAAELADAVTVTSDNPRSENPANIAAEILGGIADPANIIVELDRRVAIQQAVERARDGDVIVIAGKGHEAFQTIGDRREPLDDRDEVARALRARAGNWIEARR